MLIHMFSEPDVSSWAVIAMTLIMQKPQFTNDVFDKRHAPRVLVQQPQSQRAIVAEQATAKRCHLVAVARCSGARRHCQACLDEALRVT